MSTNLLYKEPAGNCNVIFLYSQMTDKLLPDNPKTDCSGLLVLLVVNN